MSNSNDNTMMSKPKLSSQCLKLANGIKIPQLGLGTWQSPNNYVLVDMVKAALKMGYRHIDTAMVYGNEESVGKGIRESDIPRAEIFVTTKVWNSDQGYDKTLKAFEKSKSRLGLDYVDLYLIHWPGSREDTARHGKTFLDTWRALETLYEQKKVKAIGVCNFYPHHLDDVMEVCKVKPMINQVELNPRLNQAELRSYCKKHGIVITAYSPIAQGKVLSHPVITELAEKYDKTPAQIVLRWEMQLGIVAIPKTVHLQRLKENADIFSFTLNEDEMAKMETLHTGERICPDPDTFSLGL